jgi:hypothetical protein
MPSIIFGPSNPKNVVRCENCNKPILFYQERICNLGERIPYGQDARPHQCPNEPSDKESICFCRRSIHQCRESEANHVETESATPIPAVTELKTKTIVVLDCVSQLLNYLHHEVEKIHGKGEV